MHLYFDSHTPYPCILVPISLYLGQEGNKPSLCHLQPSSARHLITFSQIHQVLDCPVCQIQFLRGFAVEFSKYVQFYPFILLSYVTPLFVFHLPLSNIWEHINSGSCVVWTYRIQKVICLCSGHCRRNISLHYLFWGLYHHHCAVHKRVCAMGM